MDIYGFEIFDHNGFEQLCINFVNEKLQQIFIELTLKSEQEEYQREGIRWTPIQYFDNKIICDLIEEMRPPGFFAVMDDVCKQANAMDADQVDDQIKRKCVSVLQPTYPQYISDAGRAFRIQHYAGEVYYRALIYKFFNIFCIQNGYEKTLCMKVKDFSRKIVTPLAQTSSR